MYNYIKKPWLMISDNRASSFFNLSVLGQDNGVGSRSLREATFTIVER